MKKLFAKTISVLILFLFIFGITQISYAAFPGKHNQSKEISTLKNTEPVAANANESKNPATTDEDLVLLVILALLLPPLAVYLKYNDTGKPFIINIILTLLCWVPGVIHALYHVLKK